jgi:hypothetical protein
LQKVRDKYPLIWAISLTSIYSIDNNIKEDIKKYINDKN